MAHAPADLESLVGSITRKAHRSKRLLSAQRAEHDTGTLESWRPCRKIVRILYKPNEVALAGHPGMEAMRCRTAEGTEIGNDLIDADLALPLTPEMFWR